MKHLFSALVLSSITACGSVSAGEVSNSTLGNMGLRNMNRMSDQDGTAVRGKGTFAYAYGSGTAWLTGSGVQSNSYAAGSTHNNSGSVAGGSNFGTVSSTFQIGSLTLSHTVGVAGGSIAFAK